MRQRRSQAPSLKPSFMNDEDRTMRRPDITAQIRAIVLAAFGEEDGEEVLRDIVEALHKTNPNKTKWTIEEVIAVCGAYARCEDN